jgi:hypothetical protein
MLLPTPIAQPAELRARPRRRAPRGILSAQGSIEAIEATLRGPRRATDAAVTPLIVRVTKACEPGARFALTIDTRPWSEASRQTTLTSDAGSEQRSCRRQLWFHLEGEGLALAFVRGSHRSVKKRFRDGAVERHEQTRPFCELHLRRGEETSHQELDNDSPLRVTEALERALREPLMAAGGGLGQYSGARAFELPPLERPTWSPEPMIRRSLRVLGSLALASTLLVATQLGLERLELRRSLRDFGRGPRPKRAHRVAELARRHGAQALRSTLDAPLPWARRNALEALRSVDSDGGLASATRLTRDPAALVWSGAVMALTELGARDALRSVAQSAKRWGPRLSALRGLALNGPLDPPAMQLALSALRREDLELEARIELLGLIALESPKPAPGEGSPNRGLVAPALPFATRNALGFSADRSAPAQSSTPEIPGLRATIEAQHRLFESLSPKDAARLRRALERCQSRQG